MSRLKQVSEEGLKKALDRASAAYVSRETTQKQEHGFFGVFSRIWTELDRRAEEGQVRPC